VASPTSSSSSARRSSPPGPPARTPAACDTSFTPRQHQHPSSPSQIDFEARVGTPIDFHQDGYLFLVSKTANVATFLRNIALQKQMGVDVQWLSPTEAAALAPGIDIEGVRGAAWCAADGVADPNGVTMGFAKGAQARGVEVVRETEVTGVKLDGHRIAEVQTSRGNISTPVVVNAAGPWAKAIGRYCGVDVPVEPERRHIFIATPERGGSWDAPEWEGRMPRSNVLVIDFESTSADPNSHSASGWATPTRSRAATSPCAGTFCRG
jgi:glycine/D-amino acid oxidase-like deaminating enzyme